MTPFRVAVFISPHGFGHAARASAVMRALSRIGSVRFEVFSTTPRWFLDESVTGLYRYHECVADVGFRQRSALAFDLEATVEALEAFLPFDPSLVERLADIVRATDCRAVLCDIAPLGIAVAERAGVPSVLVENFTWPWLYEPLHDSAPRLARFSEMLERCFARATVHVQAEPVCSPDQSADLVVPPVSRTPRRTREETRALLGIAEDVPVVVVTMGGVPQELPFLDRLRDQSDTTFLVTGAPGTATMGNVRLFDNATRIYMPDFVRTADAVVSKLGYSTVAEVWHETVPLAFVSRADFRETGPLRAWVERELPGFEIAATGFAGGEWIHRIPELLALGAGARVPRPSLGAEAIARRVLEVARA